MKLRKDLDIANYIKKWVECQMPRATHVFHSTLFSVSVRFIHTKQKAESKKWYWSSHSNRTTFFSFCKRCKLFSFEFRTRKNWSRTDGFCSSIIILNWPFDISFFLAFFPFAKSIIMRSDDRFWLNWRNLIAKTNKLLEYQTHFISST